MVVSLMLAMVQLHVNTESLTGHSYVDMTRFFRRSNGKARLTSAACG
jgi:hypothetical protein